ncbi:MAG: hypothetical protein SFZ03_08295 [Candidatus Melainabacteria bacterium]|nr:hypothetical protein [Candidatus Melainabacteria bacterium]
MQMLGLGSSPRATQTVSRPLDHAQQSATIAAATLQTLPDECSLNRLAANVAASSVRMGDLDDFLQELSPNRPTPAYVVKESLVTGLQPLVLKALMAQNTRDLNNTAKPDYIQAVEGQEPVKKEFMIPGTDGYSYNAVQRELTLAGDVYTAVTFSREVGRSPGAPEADKGPQYRYSLLLKPKNPPKGENALYIYTPADSTGSYRYASRDRLTVLKPGQPPQNAEFSNGSDALCSALGQLRNDINRSELMQPPKPPQADMVVQINLIVAQLKQKYQHLPQTQAVSWATQLWLNQNGLEDGPFEAIREPGVKGRGFVEETSGMPDDDTPRRSPLSKGANSLGEGFSPFIFSEGARSGAREQGDNVLDAESLEALAQEIGLNNPSGTTRSASVADLF